MPRELVPNSFVDDFGVVHFQRTNGWINSYNPAIATSIPSNHDVSWIPTSTKALAYIYYLTNYATEADVSPQQMLVKARLLAETRQNLACAINDTDHKVISETPQKVVKIGNFCYVFIIYHFFFPHGLL